MNTLTLSVAFPTEPLFDAICAFEAKFLKEEYDAYPILVNTAGVAIHRDGEILAAATYADAVTNNPLIAEVAAPHAFLQADGTPFPREVVAEYAGRMFNDTLVTSKAMRLRFTDILSLTVYRIARISNISLLAGISGKSEKALYRRVGIRAKMCLLNKDAQDRVEKHFNDRWDIYFARPRCVTTIPITDQETDGLENWKNAIARNPGPTCDPKTLQYITG